MGRRESSLEERLTFGDRVVHGGLVVRVGVHAEEVAGGGQGGVRAIGPSGPGVDVADPGGGGRSPRDGGADLADVADELGGFGAGGGVGGDEPGGRDTVEVLGADADAGDEGCEGGAVLGDGGLEGGNLVGEVGVAGGGPETEEEGGFGVDGGLDGADGCVGGAALDHGVESRGGETGCSSQLLGCAEFVLEVGFALDATVIECRTIIETLVDSESGRKEREESGGNDRSAHVGWMVD